MTLLHEKTKVYLGSGIAIAFAACTIWASVSVSLARTEEALQTQNKRLDYNTTARDNLYEKVNAIDARTARIEGILEQMRNERLSGRR